MRALFTYTSDDNGDRGWLLDGADHPSLNASTMPLLLAHDALEHMNGPQAIGTMSDELQAFGAICYIRGHEYSADFIGASDLGTLFETWADDDEELERPDPIELDEEAGELIDLVMQGLRRVIWRQGGSLKAMATFARRAELALAKGWTMARDRYGSRDEANATFHAVKAAISTALHGHKADYNQLLLVSINPKRQTARARILQGEY